MELSAEHVILIGLVVSFLAQTIKVFRAWFGEKLDKRLLTVLMYPIAVVLAYLFARPVLPAWPVPVEDPAVYAGLILMFIGQLVAIASAIAGFATLIYKILLEKVFEKLHLTADDFLPPIEDGPVG
jgi:hypothetical protein